MASHVDQKLLTERCWNQLLSLIEDETRPVIPVIGPELLILRSEQGEVPLYRFVAQRLLESHSLRGVSSHTTAGPDEVHLRDNLELYDAVCELIRRGELASNLYSPIKDLIQSALGAQAAIPDTLRTLVNIPAFKLFVTTTPDNLLTRALAEQGITAEEIPFSPNLPGSERRDVPEQPPVAYRAVFYMFGRASANPTYAIHDEDALEFIYKLQSDQTGAPAVMLSTLRQRNLLFIGCAMPDWLSRFFLRLAGERRLSDTHRPKREFLTAPSMDEHSRFTMFLSSFSRNTHIFPISARTFVDELARRWHERHPTSEESIYTTEDACMNPRSSDADIFISYSRTDLAAARVVMDELRDLGFNFPWFDKSALKPGDRWESDSILAVKRCTLFLPLISVTTEQREEGFFRREWYEATERAKSIEGRGFIFPVVIDKDFGGDSNQYRLVPERFRQVQFGHAPDGRMSVELREALKQALRHCRRRK